MADSSCLHSSDTLRRSIRKASQNSYVVKKNAQKELKEKLKLVSGILKKPQHERTAADDDFVKKNPDIVKISERNARRLQATKDRVLETEDTPDVINKKCDQLAELIMASKSIVVYTGAGISTAASIPDYRGPNGVWTLLKKGHELSPQDLSDAEPTFTHMSITKLFKVGRVKHVVSQNCDGLHIRSGYPRYTLSELHGNMFIECCYSCVPHKEYIRLFDVTEKTGVRRHATGRNCRSCGSHLVDTIVHFGEKGKLRSPYRWKEAHRAAKNADLILCLGSSLKVLRRYSCLWGMERKPQHRPKLAIVNLQWTPKDDLASLKINGRCDDVMKKVMEYLDYDVLDYKRELDPIYRLYTPLKACEMKSTCKKVLLPPPHLDKSFAAKRKSGARTTVKPPKRRGVSSRLKTGSNDHTTSPVANENNNGDITGEDVFSSSDDVLTQLPEPWAWTKSRSSSRSETDRSSSPALPMANWSTDIILEMDSEVQTPDFVSTDRIEEGDGMIPQPSGECSLSEVQCETETLCPDPPSLVTQESTTSQSPNPPTDTEEIFTPDNTHLTHSSPVQRCQPIGVPCSEGNNPNLGMQEKASTLEDCLKTTEGDIDSTKCDTLVLKMELIEESDEEKPKQSLGTLSTQSSLPQTVIINLDERTNNTDAVADGTIQTPMFLVSVQMDLNNGNRFPCDVTLPVNNDIFPDKAEVPLSLSLNADISVPVVADVSVPLNMPKQLESRSLPNVVNCNEQLLVSLHTLRHDFCPLPPAHAQTVSVSSSVTSPSSSAANILVRSDSSNYLSDKRLCWVDPAQSQSSSQSPLVCDLGGLPTTTRVNLDLLSSRDRLHPLHLSGQETPTNLDKVVGVSHLPVVSVSSADQWPTGQQPVKGATSVKAEISCRGLRGVETLPRCKVTFGQMEDVNLDHSYTQREDTTCEKAVVCDNFKAPKRDSGDICFSRDGALSHVNAVIENSVIHNRKHPDQEVSRDSSIVEVIDGDELLINSGGRSAEMSPGGRERRAPDKVSTSLCDNLLSPGDHLLSPCLVVGQGCAEGIPLSDSTLSKLSSFKGQGKKKPGIYILNMDEMESPYKSALSCSSPVLLSGNKGTTSLDALDNIRHKPLPHHISDMKKPPTLMLSGPLSPRANNMPDHGNWSSKAPVLQPQPKMMQSGVKRSELETCIEQNADALICEIKKCSLHQDAVVDTDCSVTSCKVSAKTITSIGPQTEPRGLTPLNTMEIKHSVCKVDNVEEKQIVETEGAKGNGFQPKDDLLLCTLGGSKVKKHKTSSCDYENLRENKLQSKHNTNKKLKNRDLTEANESKRTLVQSVPGWFGKGLTIKRKKRI